MKIDYLCGECVYCFQVKRVSLRQMTHQAVLGEAAHAHRILQRLAVVRMAVGVAVGAVAEPGFAESPGDGYDVKINLRRETAV
jgi:hypothetical protein